MTMDKGMKINIETILQYFGVPDKFVGDFTVGSKKYGHEKGEGLINMIKAIQRGGGLKNITYFRIYSINCINGNTIVPPHPYPVEKTWELLTELAKEYVLAKLNPMKK